MSVKAILENINDKSRRMWACCTEEKPTPQLTQGQGWMLNCCPPEADQHIDGGNLGNCGVGNLITAYVADDLGVAISVETFSLSAGGTFTFTGLVFDQGDLRYLTLELFTVLSSAFTIQQLNVSAELAAYGLVLPYTTTPSTFVTSSTIDTSTVGEFSATLEIVWDCGTATITVPYEVVEP